MKKEDMGILKDDHFEDALNTPQIYTIELWINNVEIRRGKFMNSKMRSLKLNDNDDNDLKDDEMRYSMLKDSLNEEMKSYEGDNETRKTIDNIMMIKFNILELRKIVLIQGDALNLPMKQKITGVSQLPEELIEMSMKNLEGKPITRNVGGRETKKTSFSKSHSSKQFQDEQESQEDENVLAATKVAAKYLEQEKTTTKSHEIENKRRRFSDSTTQVEYFPSLRTSNFQAFSANIEKLNEQQKAGNINKGSCIMFAMSPMKLMNEMSSGPIPITVENMLPITNDPEITTIGESKIYFPIGWRDIIYKTIVNPLSAPVSINISDEANIEESPGYNIGVLTYTMILTCHAGCVITKTMPTESGLYTSLKDCEKELCHKPRVREDIEYFPLRRKAEKDNYKKMFSVAADLSTN